MIREYIPVAAVILMLGSALCLFESFSQRNAGRKGRSDMMVFLAIFLDLGALIVLWQK